jgi:hypothetical protein
MMPSPSFAITDAEVRGPEAVWSAVSFLNLSRDQIVIVTPGTRSEKPGLTYPDQKKSQWSFLARPEHWQIEPDAERVKKAFHLSFGFSCQVDRFAPQPAESNKLQPSRLGGSPWHDLVFFHSPSRILKHRNELFSQAGRISGFPFGHESILSGWRRPWLQAQ